MTLLPIIQRVVAPGTTVWSDEWRAYAGLVGLGYVHQTVNHSQNFTDPVSGMCTNHVQAYWCAVKRRFKRMVGTASVTVPSYLDEHVARALGPYIEDGVRELAETYRRALSAVGAPTFYGRKHV